MKSRRKGKNHSIKPAQMVSKHHSGKNTSDYDSKIILILLCLALAIKLPIAAFVQLPFTGDAVEYYNTSVHMANSGFYSMDGETPNLRRPFGYPVILATSHLVFGVSMQIPLYLQAVLSAIEAVVIFVICLKLLDKKSAYVAYFAMLLLPGINFHIPTYLSENGSLLFLVLFIFFFFFTGEKKRDGRWINADAANWIMAILCGILLSLLVYSRSAFIILIPIFGIIFLMTKNTALKKRALVSIIILVIVMLAWASRNYAVSGHFSFFGIEGPATIYVGTRTEFDGKWVGWAEKLENGQIWSRDKHLQSIIEMNLSMEENNKIFMQEAFKAMQEETWDVAKIGMRNSFYTLWMPPYAYNFFIKDYVYATGYDFSSSRLFWTTIANFYFLLWAIFLLLSIVGVFICWKLHKEFAVFSALLVLGTMFIFSLLQPIPRYHTVLIPILAIHFGLAVSKISRWIYKRYLKLK